jgi:hypothetical protein
LFCISFKIALFPAGRTQTEGVWKQGAEGTSEPKREEEKIRMQKFS